jgi:hypothetical protein
MRCSESSTPLTATAVTPPTVWREGSIVAQFEALLFESALKPLAASLGFYGEIVTGSLAAGIAHSLERGRV